MMKITSLFANLYPLINAMEFKLPGGGGGGESHHLGGGGGGNRTPLSFQNFKLPATTPLKVILFIVGVSAIIAIVVYLRRSKKFMDSGITKGTKGVEAKDIQKALTGTEDPRLRAALAGYHLTVDERREVDEAFKHLQAEDGTYVDALRSSELLDRYFCDEYNRVNEEKQGKEKTNSLNSLFHARNVIEYFNTNGRTGGLSKTKQVASPITVTINDVEEKDEIVKGKKKRTLVLAGQSYTGNLVSVSAEKCTLSTPVDIKPKKMIKLDFQAGTGHPAVLGQVQDVKKSRDTRTADIVFLKVPAYAENEINAFVYGYV
jgi:hypothetical protein